MKLENVITQIKNNKKKSIIISASAIVGIALIITMYLLIFEFKVFCSHQWQDATCSSPQICSKCEKTQGIKLEHIWIEADCENPETCSLCSETRAEALGHNWENATCENPKTCKTCKKIEGKAKGHDWNSATCESPKTCKKCDKTEGKALGHDWLDATYESPKMCSRCGATDGYPLEMSTESTYSNFEISGEWYDINGSGITMYIEERDSGYYAEFRDSKSSYSWHMSGGHYDNKYDIFDVFLFDNTTCVNVYTVNGMVQTEHIYQNKAARIGFSMGCAFVVVEGDTTFDECYFVRN